MNTIWPLYLYLFMDWSLVSFIQPGVGVLSKLDFLIKFSLSKLKFWTMHKTKPQFYWTISTSAKTTLFLFDKEFAYASELNYIYQQYNWLKWFLNCCIAWETSDRGEQTSAHTEPDRNQPVWFSCYYRLVGFDFWCWVPNPNRTD